MNFFEKKTPLSPEEQRAEDTMTKSQKKLSSEQEKNHRKLSELGIPGHLEVSGMELNDQEEEVYKLTGELDGHAIELTGTFDVDFMGVTIPWPNSCSGTVDGVVVDNRYAKQLWNKYVDFAERAPEVARARKEISNFPSEPVADLLSRKEK